MEASEKRKAQMREYRRTHKEQYNARQRKFYQNHKDYYKKYQEKPYKEIEKLTNNWNELEEWVKIKYKEYSKNKKNHIDVAMSGTFYAVLDKMKKIKENNENN